MVVTKFSDVVTWGSKLAHISDKTPSPECAHTGKNRVKQVSGGSGEGFSIGFFGFSWSFSDDGEFVGYMDRWEFVWYEG